MAETPNYYSGFPLRSRGCFWGILPTYCHILEQLEPPSGQLGLLEALEMQNVAHIRGVADKKINKIKLFHCSGSVV